MVPNLRFDAESRIVEVMGDVDESKLREVFGKGTEKKHMYSSNTINDNTTRRPASEVCCGQTGKKKSPLVKPNSITN